MAKQVSTYVAEVRPEATPDNVFVRYQIVDSELTDLSKWGDLTFVVTPANTVAVERAAILAAIKVKEGIA